MLGLLVAAQIAVVAYAPDSVNACDAVDVTVAISRRGTAPPTLVHPTLAPLEVLRRSSSVRVIRPAGGAPIAVAEYRFVVTTDRVGRVVLPPFEARFGEERAVSRPLSLTVGPMLSRPAPAVVARARVDTSAELTMAATPPPDTVFVGQQATYEVAVFLNQTARDRLRRNPTFYPPEMQAMLAYDLPTASVAERGRRRTGTPCFDALVYRRALFPLVPGRLVIPPAQLVYSTGFGSASLFSREESHEIQTDSVTLVAVNPPSAGRPAEYTGTVGDVRLDALIDSSRSRVGDPMLLTMRVTGSGNVKLFPRPVVRVPWGALVQADERVTVDSSSARIGGAKEFDWVLTPRIAGELDVPPVRYGYFDPVRRRYDVAVAPGRRVRVAPGTLATSDTGHAESALAIRTHYDGQAWPPVQSHPMFWLALALVPLPALGSRLRRRARRAQVTTAADPLRVLVAAPPREPAALRRQFVRALAHRLGCNPEDFTHPGALDRALRRAGVSHGTSVRAESLLRSLDAAAYAGTGGLPVGASREAGDVARAVNEEGLARVELPFWIPVLVLGVSLLLVADAVAADDAPAIFRRGVSAYVRQDYPAARDAFAQVVTLAPRSADAWANYGTASWSSADTAAAALGWRQALAIEPAAGDMHAYLAAFRDVGPASPGWVPPLPRGATVWLFAMLWTAAWIIAWLSSSRASLSWSARLPLPLVVCSLVVGLLAIEVEARVAGNRLGVVRSGSALWSDPAIGMDRGPAVGTGEIVRVVGRRGTWTRVEASSDRDGWMPSEQLIAMSERRPQPAPEPPAADSSGFRD